MHFSLNENPLPESKVSLLKKLLFCQNIKILSQHGGGNSRVYCIDADGKKWALKSYPSTKSDKRHRLGAELLTYQFLNQHQISAVPSLNTYTETENWLIMEWIQGEIPSTYYDTDITQAINFLESIYQLNTHANHLPLASEACLSLKILLTQIQHRFDNLYRIADNEPELMAFLVNDFLSLFKFYETTAVNGFLQHHWNIDETLSETKRSLIPADFGFHNSIRDKNGKLFFFDFDYFGWDDPVKLLADIIWHPKMCLSQKHREQFIKGLTEIYKDDTFILRFHFTKPLYGLRWVLILLNEFNPNVWQNRQHAGTYTKDLREVKNIQLNRAKELLMRIKGNSYG
ncbi:MAG TPA: aminoglycoside phosphotransferase family protein [Gammaproteobacteria bacterium]|jgi:hypothetical protein|nr:aminoglycoside phosphotransferase family protein [Gammaproteobacteria bacterium]